MSADSSKKNRTGCAGLIAAAVILGVLIYVFNMIPGGGLVLIVGVVALWGATIAGKVWPDAPPVLAGISNRVQGNLKVTMIATGLFLIAGFTVRSQQAVEAQRTEQVAFERQEQKRREATQRKAEKRAEKARHDQALARFKSEKDGLYEKLTRAKTLIGSGDFKGAEDLLRTLSDSVDGFAGTPVVDLLEFEPLPKGIMEAKKQLGAAIAGDSEAHLERLANVAAVDEERDRKGKMKREAKEILEALRRLRKVGKRMAGLRRKVEAGGLAASAKCGDLMRKYQSEAKKLRLRAEKYSDVLVFRALSTACGSIEACVSCNTSYALGEWCTIVDETLRDATTWAREL